MRYRRLGESGLSVAPICLGTMMFGDRTDEAASRRIVDSARDAGFNFIDTADVYTLGASEEIVGRAIKEHRDFWILATKLGNPMSKSLNDRGLGRAWVQRAAEDSLRRLDTEVIDIYYLHREDHETPLAETIGAIGDLIRQGKIRYFGLSNYRSWRISEIVRLCVEMNVPRPIVSQPYYNALNRMPEVEQLPVCGHHGLGVVPYSPLARGVLTGKYRPGTAPSEETRAGKSDMRMMETEWREESLVIAQKIKEHAEAKGVTPVQFAVNWVLNNALVTGVIAGPRTEEQWSDYMGALDYRFTEEDEALVDALVTTGHPSTPGYNDPMYPVEGRVRRV